LLLNINNLMEKQRLKGFILSLNGDTNHHINEKLFTSLSCIEIRNSDYSINGLNILLGNNF